MKELSVVIPVMNEKDNVGPIMQRLAQALRSVDHEIIFVDDGSKDGTPKIIRELANKNIRLIQLSRNYGQSTAMAAGIDYAEGNYIALLDGDLQNDPEDITMMLRVLKEGDWDVVAGNRKHRQDNALIRKLPSRIANRLIRKMTGVYIEDYGCTLKVFKQEYAHGLGLYGELHRFIPVLASMQGARITQVNVQHHARIHGQSKYGLNRTFKVTSDLLLMVFFQKYLQKPMHLFGALGTLSFGGGILVNLYLLVLKLAGEPIWGKPLMILGVILLLSGIQFFTIGILAEMNMRTYFESQNKKPYRIRATFDGKDKKAADAYDEDNRKLSVDPVGLYED
ncbi:glycosyltransferase family 2 protein [Filimonas effusa]|uniref:Glycosyltransferase n=1 Tax=Filimonas effusa TaxID=2508721 RepID=A0A4Q1DCH4_9BACT|nr:glycosyltransferase family 2 protein [Filimonas effusa]RXK86323.1 glycosyltransferase [Filimonas effusa]